MIFDTFTKRQKRLERAGKQGVYQYDLLPPGFRVQVVGIWQKAIGIYTESGYFGTDRPAPSNSWWKFLHDTIAHEHGVFYLGDDPQENPVSRCANYVLRADPSGALDIIECSLRVIDKGVRDMTPYEKSQSQITISPDEAIEEINHRFREHGIGYQISWRRNHQVRFSVCSF